MRILVTGANGFIGSVLVRRAADDGHTIVASVRRPEQTGEVDRRAVAMAVGDLGPETDWSAAVAGVDAVIHLAGRAHVLRESSVSPATEFQRANVAGTLRLAQQAHAAGVRRFVFVSSSGVGGAVSGDRPLHEMDMPRPVSLYAQAKWAAEQALAELAATAALDIVIVRPALVYGPGAPGNMQRLLAAIGRRVPLPLADINNQRSLVGVENLADLLLLCAEHSQAAGRTFYAADGVVSTTELVRIFALGMSLRARLVAIPVPVMRALFSVLRKHSIFEQLYCSLVLDNQAAVQTLGWRPGKSIHQGLLEAAAEFARKIHS